MFNTQCMLENGGQQFEHTLSLSLSARLMWVAGMLAASASIIYPAISAMVSRNAEPEQQGVVLGILTGWLYTVRIYITA